MMQPFYLKYLKFSRKFIFVSKSIYYLVKSLKKVKDTLAWEQNSLNTTKIRYLVLYFDLKNRRKFAVSIVKRCFILYYHSLRLREGIRWRLV